MKRLTFGVVAVTLLIIVGTSHGQSLGLTAPESVTVPSGTLRLTGLIWRPSGSGRFPAILFSHGNARKPTNAEILGPVFARHGYVFLYLFRRGNGLSGDQSPFFGDLINRERQSNGPEAAERLAAQLLATDYLDDTIAGLSFLRSRPNVVST